MSIDTVLSALRGSAAFVSSLFAFTGMYERKVVYVRHRLPH